MPLLTLEPWQLAVLFAPAILNTWGIWHIFKHTFATQMERGIWLLICVFVPLLGGFVYLFFGYRRATGKAGPLFTSPNSATDSKPESVESKQAEQLEQAEQAEEKQAK